MGDPASSLQGLLLRRPGHSATPIRTGMISGIGKQSPPQEGKALSNGATCWHERGPRRTARDRGVLGHPRIKRLPGRCGIAAFSPGWLCPQWAARGRKSILGSSPHEADPRTRQNS